MFVPPKNFTPKNGVKIGGGGGLGGVPLIFFHPKSYFLCDLKPHAKFHNPTITPSGRKVSEAERKKETLSSVTAHASRSDQFRCIFASV